MQLLDWSILIGFAVFISLVAYSTKKYTKSVADFLAASRCGGKYLLAMGDGMAGLGAISIVASFQLYYEAGFTPFWWQSIFLPLSLFVAIIGWIIYRFRQTRALTMAQFFEIRYSRRFRVFSGFLAFLSGIINFGIFPSVGARFFVYFCRLPETFTVAGFDVSAYALVMIILIGIALAFTWIGGQIAVLITDFIQSFVCNVIFIVILVVLFMKFDWSQISSAISAAPENQSMVNPFKISGLENYNLFYYLIAFYIVFYGAYSWQGQQAYNSSAVNAHEARMSKILGYIRFITPILFMMILPICTYTLFHNADFAKEAAQANEILSSIDSVQIQKQMRVPIAMSTFLPTGIIGLLCAVMFAAFVSTHDTYLHSWGSIFLQDVVMPFRRKPFTPKAHIRNLRLSILGVAVFIFFFSLWFNQSEDILMFFALSGTIFLAGSGIVIIGGLYWKRGTTAGAWVAMIVGLIMAVLGFAFSQGCWPGIAGYIQRAFPDFWLWLKQIAPSLNTEKFLYNPQEWFFFSTIICTVSYIAVSLLTVKTAFNLDRMLHRGKYAIESEKSPEDNAGLANWKKALGFGGNLTTDDKFIIWSSYSYIFISLFVVLAGIVYNAFFGIPDKFWMIFWRGYIWVFFVLTILLTIWLGIGGFVDLKKLFRTLKTVKRNDRDDGTVVSHHNLDEE
ncbi:MAG: sodium:solute symporter [Actinobacteria bacterium]|nr:sodium:solute symporter [Actinomycetota bacterium]